MCGEFIGLLFKLDFCFLWIWFNVSGVFLVFVKWLWWLLNFFLGGCDVKLDVCMVFVDNCKLVDVEGLGRVFVDGNFLWVLWRLLGIRLFFFIELCNILLVLIVCVLIVLLSICFFFGVNFLDELCWDFGVLELDLLLEWVFELFFLFLIIFIVGMLWENIM